MNRNASPFWFRHVHADRRATLLLRNRVKSALHADFEVNGFTEVECGVLQASPGNEAHLHAFSTERVRPDGRREQHYLHTSPEFSCKKLLAAGETRIFDFARVFRNRERGVLHAPEFTMLEWYRVDEPYEEVQRDCLRLLKIASDIAAGPFRFRERRCDANVDADRLTVEEAFRYHAGIELLATLSEDGQ